MARLRFFLTTVIAALAAVLAGSLVAAPATAQAATHIKAALVAESAVPAAGQRVTLAFAMAPDPRWHGYWINGGDAGMETRVEWTLPAGATASAIRYPVPQPLLIAGLMNHVYERPYALLVELTLPAGLAPGTRLPIGAKLDWLACTDEVCVPEAAALATELIVGDGAVTEEAKAAFDRYRAALPRPIGSPAKFAVVGERLRIEVPLPASQSVEGAHFFALTDGALDYAAPQTVTRDGDRLVIETRARDGAGALGKIEGVLRIGRDLGLSLEATPGEVAAVAAGASGTGESAGGGAGVLLAALGGAVVGGLLLNVMPCVFPILSLKALSLARAGGDEAGARRDALAYAGGVILVCLALGGVLLALRAGGAAVGWAFQLQDPRVILMLLLLVAAIGLNLAGLFELPGVTGGDALAAKPGAQGAFWTGALAAFVATPCTGPFMAGALGAALVLPAAGAMLVFGGLGLGLALPFLLLGFVPTLRERLPKPGPWMARLRRILSLPMLLTALGLAWILGKQTGVDGMTLGLGAAMLVAVALWWIGRRQARGATRAWWPLAPAMAAVVALMLVVPRAPDLAVAAGPAGTLGAEPFSEARLAALRAEGRPVFVYFTADWCLTCKVNEKGAIERDEVAAAFERGNVAVLVGDWTSGDAAIGGFLARHGRSGVPLYLHYPAGGEARILPQVLTPGILTALVE